MGQLQTFLDDGDQHVSADGDPDLRLHGVLAHAQKSLDAQVLFDPFEEEFHLPALRVQVGVRLRLQGKIVGQKRDAVAGLVLDYHAPQGRWIILARRIDRQHAGLIAQHVGVGAIHRMGVAPLELGIALRSVHKEGLCLMDSEQSREIQIAAIQQIECTGLDVQNVQHIDFVGLGDVNEAGNGTVQIQPRAQLDAGFGLVNRCPRIHRQAQVDGRGVEGVNRRVQIDAQRFSCIKRTGHANQMLRKIGVELPGPRDVRIGQGSAKSSGSASPCGRDVWLGRASSLRCRATIRDKSVEQTPLPEIDPDRRNP